MTTATTTTGHTTAAGNVCYIIGVCACVCVCR